MLSWAQRCPRSSIPRVFFFPISRRALTLAAALAVDAWLGEPPRRIHPVVWIGAWIDRLTARAPRRGPARALIAGAGVTVATVLPAGCAGWAAERWLPRPIAWPIQVWLLTSAFAGRSLFEAAEAVRGRVIAGDLPAARRALGALVSRPTDRLAAPLVIAAAIESVGENAGDSFVAPLGYYLIGGLPGVLAYRAINTLDAMIGYRGEYEDLGKAAARLDDLVNFIPARLAALFIALAALPGGRTIAALRVARRDAGRTASPNAGWPMAALAGALDVELEKVDHYRLGDPVRPLTADRLAEAIGIVRRALNLWTGVVLLAASWRDRPPRPATGR